MKRKLEGLYGVDMGTASETKLSNEFILSQAQNKHAYELQRALRQLPIEVVIKHIRTAMSARGDFTLEDARKLERVVGDLVWEFL